MKAYLNLKTQQVLITFSKLRSETAGKIRAFGFDKKDALILCSQLPRAEKFSLLETSPSSTDKSFIGIHEKVRVRIMTAGDLVDYAETFRLCAECFSDLEGAWLESSWKNEFLPCAAGNAFLLKKLRYPTKIRHERITVFAHHGLPLDEQKILLQELLSQKAIERDAYDLWVTPGFMNDLKKIKTAKDLLQLFAVIRSTSSFGELNPDASKTQSMTRREPS